LRYLTFSGRPAKQIELVEAYCGADAITTLRGVGYRLENG
jgi:hypothetical protein